MRRKQVDSDRVRVDGQPQLARELEIPELVVIGAASRAMCSVFSLLWVPGSSVSWNSLRFSG
jgi:solute carrier family 7 (cationic amino acid transporter), member 1